MFRSSKTTWANRNIKNYKYEKFHMPRWQGVGGIHRKYERALAAGVTADFKVNYDEQNTYLDALKDTKIFNETDNYDSETVKKLALQNYITNITKKKTTEDEIERNLSNNLDTVASVIQENVMDINIKNSKVGDVKLVQSNEEHKKLANELTSFYEDVLKIIKDSQTEQGENNEVTNEVDVDFGTSNDNSQTATSSQGSEQKAEQKAKQTASDEEFHAPRWQGAGKIHRKYERALFAGAEIKGKAEIGITNTTQNDTQLSYEENKNYNTVMRDTEISDVINKSYDSLIETIETTKTTLNQENESKMKSETKQSNVGTFYASGSEVNGFELVQENKAIVEMSAALTIQSILNTDASYTEKAIMLDMLGATNNFSETSSVENKTEQVASSEQKTVMGSTQSLEQSATNTSTVSSIIAIVIFIVIGGVLIKFLMGSGSNGQGGIKSNYNPLYNPIAIPKV